MGIPFRGQIDLAVLRRINGLVLIPSRGSLIVGYIVAFVIFWGLVGVPLTQGQPLTLVVVLVSVGLFACAL